MSDPNGRRAGGDRAVTPSWRSRGRHAGHLFIALRTGYKAGVRKLGIVDLGSNTARLVVYAYEPGGWFRLADQIREPLRLGQGLGRDGNLTREAMARAEAALRLFARYAGGTGLEDLEVLGTSVLRDAGNRDAFLDRIARLGLRVTVLSGEEEAALGVCAVANGFELSDAWVMDLGGGSVQLSLMRERRFVHGRAYPLGALRLTETFLTRDPPRPGDVEALEVALAEQLAPIAAEMRAHPLPLVAMGGTVRNLARAVQKGEDYPLPDRLHGYFLQRRAAAELAAKLLALDRVGREQVPGIKPYRADVIVAGALVLRWLLRRARLDGVWVSGQGVREGALYRRFLPEPCLLADVRAFSVENLLNHYPQPRRHVAQVRRLAGKLFEGLRPLHGLGPREAFLLDAAAMLQDIGLAVSYYRHDRHGSYLVSSAPLHGFTHREQALLALLVKYHLSGNPRLGAFRRLCRPGDKRLLRSLAACLRIAEHLDRTRSGRVKDLEAEVGARRVTVRAIAGKGPVIELWEAERHAPLFARAFGRELRFEQTVARRGRSKAAAPGSKVTRMLPRAGGAKTGTCTSDRRRPLPARGPT